MELFGHQRPLNTAHPHKKHPLHRGEASQQQACQGRGEDECGKMSPSPWEKIYFPARQRPQAGRQWFMHKRFWSGRVKAQMSIQELFTPDPKTA